MEDLFDIKEERLKLLKDKIIKALEFFKYMPRVQWTNLPLEKTLVETLFELMEKIEPKRVEYLDEAFLYFKCASCGELISYFDDKESHKYCLNCGQKLDWSEPEKKTINEWCNENNIVMLDPDGFDRTDPKLFEQKFTKQEFIKGLSRSTIEGVDVL